MSFLLSLDYFLTNLFNKSIPHNILFDYFFSVFSFKGSFIFIWIVIIVLLTIFEKKINKKLVLYFFFSLGITLILVFGMKHIIQRIRPTELCGSDFSFPSGHATTAFAASTVLTFFDKKRRWFYYTVAVLISYSRIYLGCHYFFDVVMGGIIGYLIAKALLSNKKIQEKLF